MRIHKSLLLILVVFSLSCKSVSQDPRVFSIENPKIEVLVNPNLMTIDVIQKEIGKKWSMINEGMGDLLVEHNGKDQIYSFRDFRVERVSPIAERGGKGLELSIVSPRLKSIRVRIRVIVSEISSDLTVEVVPPDSTSDYVLKDLFYPRAYNVSNPRNSYAVLPIRHGCILPWNWKEEIHTEYTIYAAGENLYMPWWGIIQGRSGFIAIMETPDDAKLKFDFSPNSFPLITPHWLTSKGILGYGRRILYHFEEDADHVSLAKYYRYYLRENKQYLSLTHKLKDNPRVKKLLGTIIVPMTICTNDHRISSLKKSFVSFEETMKKIVELKENLNVQNAVIHLDGWGARGYDNLHPDPFPPCETAGGWEGLRKLAEKVEDLGYLLALHDNYRDLYLDAPSFNDTLCLFNRKNEYPIIEIWAGGPQSILCPYCAIEFIKRNYKILKNKNIPITASYLDVFTAVPLEECYNPRHPITRKECKELRSEAFKYLRSLGLLVSSEEGVDWGLPWLDFLYYAPTPELGIPTPLFSIVYHDAVVTPWTISSDEDYLYCILCGGVPIVGKVERVLKNFELPSKLHKKIGLDSLISHKFLSPDYFVQECTFSSGAKVWVDFNRKRYKIEGVRGIKSEERIYRAFADIEPKISQFEYLGGEKFRITYKWLVNTKLQEDFLCFVHFLSLSSLQEENILFNADHHIKIPTSEWDVPSEILDGPYFVDWGFKPGEYELVIGLYDSQTGQRLPLRGRDDGLKRILLGRLIISGVESRIANIRFAK